MKVSFLFPGSGKHEAIDNWIRTLSRHTRHDVRLVRTPEACASSDCAFLITEARTYPSARIDADIDVMPCPFGVIHNNDNPGVPTPGDYPSFVWTKKGYERLFFPYSNSANSVKSYICLLRQPVFPPIVKPSIKGVCLGTFGHVEAKKQTFEMGRWAKKAGFPFVAFGPDAYTAENELYIRDVRSVGGVTIYEWVDEIEDLAPFLRPCTHFLFVLTDAKKGSGGSPTSPRFAGFFNRPIIVIDDEDTFAQDGYHVYPSLADIPVGELLDMKPPNYAWSPDAYLDRLCMETLDYWRER